VDTAVHHVGYRRLGRGTIAGVLVTLAIHGGIGAVVYVSQIASPPRPEAARDVIVTKMVALGKPRDPFWLPRLVQPAKPKVQQPVIKVTEDPNAPPAPKEAPKPEDAEVSKDLKRALERARRLSQLAAAEEPPEGSLTGSAQGTSSEATQGDEYATQIFETIRRNWTAPTGLVNDAELVRLTTEIVVRVDDNGTLLEPRMRKPSGNQFFDDSCMQAIKAAGKVPPPPAAVKALYRRGVSLDFVGKELAR
jgi:protein TonB